MRRGFAISVRFLLIGCLITAASAGCHKKADDTTTPTTPSAPLVSVTISGVRNPMAIGDTEQLTVTGTYGDGQTADVTRNVTWQSGDATVFAVSKQGLLTAVGKGLAAIGASYGGANTTVMAVVDQPGCTYAVSPTSMTFDRGIATGTSKVTTQPGCVWTVASDSDWLSAGSLTFTGTHAFSYSVSFADGPFDIPARVGHVTVRWDTPTAGQNVEVTQNGGCHLPIRGVSFSVGADGGRIYTTLDDSDNATPETGKNPWQVVSASSWITPFAPYFSVGVWQWGSVASDFSATVDPNPDAQPRVGSVVICDRTFTVTQAGR